MAGATHACAQANETGAWCDAPPLHAPCTGCGGSARTAGEGDERVSRMLGRRRRKTSASGSADKQAAAKTTAAVMPPKWHAASAHLPQIQADSKVCRQQQGGADAVSCTREVAAMRALHTTKRLRCWALTPAAAATHMTSGPTGQTRRIYTASRCHGRWWGSCCASEPTGQGGRGTGSLAGSKVQRCVHRRWWRPSAMWRTPLRPP